MKDKKEVNLRTIRTLRNMANVYLVLFLISFLIFLVYMFLKDAFIAQLLLRSVGFWEAALIWFSPYVILRLVAIRVRR